MRLDVRSVYLDATAQDTHKLTADIARVKVARVIDAGIMSGARVQGV